MCGKGLVALAATIANHDLMITTDTLAAHLAGALGKPVWVLLQHHADWRWLALDLGRTLSLSLISHPDNIYLFRRSLGVTNG